jgi:hypothetical protein
MTPVLHEAIDLLYYRRTTLPIFDSGLTLLKFIQALRYKSSETTTIYRSSSGVRLNTSSDLCMVANLRTGAKNLSWHHAKLVHGDCRVIAASSNITYLLRYGPPGQKLVGPQIAGLKIASTQTKPIFALWSKSEPSWASRIPQVMLSINWPTSTLNDLSGFGQLPHGVIGNTDITPRFHHEERLG